MKASLVLGTLLLATIVGSANAADSGDLERNKALVKQFFAAVEGRDKATVEKIVREDYIQHMPMIPSGRAAILHYIDMVAPKGLGKMPQFARVIAEADLVMVHFRREDPNGPVATMEIFRIQGGQIAEHWAVTEPIPPADKTRNKNGAV
ncbi:MAG TPA: nuclear transport factor 2 family protein [Steroidobacteraceae bacterium]|jgi:predicted SnoaL-like aldol condensation-catalyzing enzyme|nr:nuclear transport factor 2 family protein [Steroidobacteraceae bacterium]